MTHGIWGFALVTWLCDISRCIMNSCATKWLCASFRQTRLLKGDVESNTQRSADREISKEVLGLGGIDSRGDNVAHGCLDIREDRTSSSPRGILQVCAAPVQVLQLSF
eukprot:TRINITY_DN1284_c0_g1_i6.p1 TRINITY_DN1284_c0_g1~~TRINITY_DN1284_c0_g1_i6.p1  ORF type:complete len:108 (-),score=2.18 TRINITY_DN1284_c0_g1_i6:242-565(-)